MLEGRIVGVDMGVGPFLDNQLLFIMNLFSLRSNLLSVPLHLLIWLSNAGRTGHTSLGLYLESDHL